MGCIDVVFSVFDQRLLWLWSDGFIELTSCSGEVLSRTDKTIYQDSLRAAAFVSGKNIVIGSWDENKIQCWGISGSDLRLKWEEKLGQPTFFSYGRHTNSVYCSSESGACIRVNEEGNVSKIARKTWLVSEISKSEFCFSFRGNLFHSDQVGQGSERCLAKEKSNISNLVCCAQGAFYFSIGGLVNFWDRHLSTNCVYDQELDMRPSRISYNNKDRVVSIVYRDEDNNSMVKAIRYDKQVVYRKTFSSKLGHPMVLEDSQLIVFTRVSERSQPEKMVYNEM